MMADCATLETAFSHFIPELVGSMISTVLNALSLLFFEWHMALAALWVIPVAFIIIAASSKVQDHLSQKSMQAKMLRVVQKKEYQRVGDDRTITVDARIIVEAGASLAKVSVTQEGGKIKIEASGTIDAVEISAPVIVDLAVDGKIGEVNVKAAAVLSVEGKTTTAVPI